jgi:SAM-dependent methyltransferase
MNKSFHYSMKYFEDRLKKILHNFFTNIDDALNIIKEYKYNDKIIYQKLAELYVEEKTIDYNLARYNNANNKLNHIKHYLKKFKNNNYKNILDIGCEDCHQVEVIGKFLNIKDFNCLNIENWNNSGYGLKRDTCNLKMYDGFNIPYKDNSFDVIIIFQTLHHIEYDIHTYVRNINRILRKGGILIIREHNCNEKYFDKLIDIEHGLYDVVKNNNMKFFDNYYGNYKSVYEWDKIINLKKIWFKQLDTSTKSYYMIYYKA